MGTNDAKRFTPEEIAEAKSRIAEAREMYRKGSVQPHPSGAPRSQGPNPPDLETPPVSPE